MTNENYKLLDNEYQQIQEIRNFGISHNKMNRESIKNGLETLNLGIDWL